MKLQLLFLQSEVMGGFPAAAGSRWTKRAKSWWGVIKIHWDGYAQSHSRLRLPVGQWDHSNGFILPAPKGGDQELALMHQRDPTAAGWSQTDFCCFLLFFLCFPLAAALPY